MLGRLVQRVIAGDTSGARAWSFIGLFVLYRLCIAAPYIVLLVMGGTRLGALAQGLIVGILLTGLALSVVKLLVRQRVLRALWDVYASVYDGLLYLYPYRHLLDLVVERIHVRPHMTVVDLGCGTGNLLCRLHNKQVKLVGVDQSRRMLSCARKKCIGGVAEVVLHEASALEFLCNLADDSVDVVVMSNVLYTYTDRSRLWQELLRVLKADGYAIVANPDRRGSRVIIVEHLRHDSWIKLLHPKLVAVWIIDALISLLESAGHFSFPPKEELREELAVVGAQMHSVRRCYGGSRRGVSLLFTVSRKTS
jgi:ubiquinone/menaquinone biosynthesis C-methylase UbiE